MRRASTSQHTHFQALEPRRLFSTFMVTTAADSGPGSLRQAILDSNNSPGKDEIHFDIGAGGVQTIAPQTALPRIDDEVIIDGTTQPGYAGKPIIEINGASTANADGFLIFFGDGSTLKGLVINRFDGWGIRDVSAGFNTIQNCYIGTNVAGNADLGNGTGGISLFSRENLVGGPGASHRNVISGNGSTSTTTGVGVQTTTAGGGNVIRNNFIGTTADGKSPLGNSAVGVFVTDTGTQITGNLIAYNGSAGVCIGPSGRDNPILGNMIFSNGGLGIDLRSASSDGPDGPTPNDTLDQDTGGNNLQNAPLVTKAAALEGKLNLAGELRSEPNKQYRIEFFINPQGDTEGEGRKFFHAIDVTTDNNGKATFDIDVPDSPRLGVITATATDPENNTSEFGNRKGITVQPVTGTVFDDRDADGVQDSNEPGLADWRVYLDTNKNGIFDKKERSVLTDANGKYNFSPMVAGTYQVRVAGQDGWRQTAPGSLFYNRSLPGPDSGKPADFAFTNSVLIKGGVFADLNQNGKQDAGESPLVGVRVFLDTDGDGIWDSNERSRITNSAGAYRFAGIKKGKYTVRVETPSGGIATAPPSGFYNLNLKPGQGITRNFGLFFEQEIPE